MQLLILVAGIVGAALPQHFGGQHTLGWALIALAVLLTIIQLIFVGVVFKKATSASGGFRPSGRNRRGF